MQSSPLKQLDLPSEYDSAVANTFRFLNLGWLMISLYVALSLVYLSGAEYRSVIFYALGAPLAYVTTSWIKREPWSQLRLLPVMAYIYWLPFAVDEFAKSPWYSYGLIATCAAMSSIVFSNNINSILFIFVAVLAQYFAVSQRFSGVSDNEDSLLLNSYFASSWVSIAGVATLVILKRYYTYCQQLDTNLKDVEKQYWERSQSISKLNLKDYINLKLHGTILNTLIVAQRMSEVASREKISEQLKVDLSELEPSNPSDQSGTSLMNTLRSKIDFGRLKVEINQNASLDLASQDTELLIELIREASLNIIKHTNSDKLLINVNQEDENKVIVTINEDLNEVVSNDLLSKKAVSAMQSKSMLRLCNESDSKYQVVSFSTGSLLHRITMNLIDRDLNILNETKQIRRRSLTSFVNAISSISIVFSFIAIPGFIYLKIPAPMIMVVSICVFIHLYLLKQKSSDVFLVSLLAILPLTLIPYSYTIKDVCTNLEALPWVVNSLLGAFLFGSYTSANVILRWLPGFVMFAECLSANYFLPSQCSSVLNGTTPGIAIALILARNMITRRSRNAKLDRDLEDLLRLQSGQNDQIQELVSAARGQVLSKVRSFANNHLEGKDSPTELGHLINLVRAYLLCSEKFERQFFRDLFDWTLARYESGVNTSLEIFEVGTAKDPVEADFNREFSGLNKIFNHENLSMTITVDEKILVELRPDRSVSDDLFSEVAQNDDQVIFTLVKE